MEVKVDIEIEKSKQNVWSAITNIENYSDMISEIMRLNVIERPAEGLVGIKWKETRMMFGKEASEVMWITEAVENEYYCTRAESHGSVYVTKLSLEKTDNGTILTMIFKATAQSFIIKIISVLMGVMIKGSMKKALKKDLEDIKEFVEKQ